MNQPVPPNNYDTIHSGIVGLLEDARRVVARNVNALMTASYWEIGRRIVEAEQGGQERAEDGEILIKRLAQDLGAHFGRGFGWRNLFQMRAFYLAWPDKLQTVSAISGVSELGSLSLHFTLPWSAYVRLLAVKNEQARVFYETEALRSGWSVRQLDRQINSQFYERMALSQNKVLMLEKAGQVEPTDNVTLEAAIKPALDEAGSFPALDCIEAPILSFSAAA
jgi:DUF1016 N-terminal domain